MGDIVKKSDLNQFLPARERAEGNFVESVRNVSRHFLPSKRVTPHEAALILNVPESYLESLLEEKKIPFVMNGTRRKVRYKDVINYKSERDMKRSQGLVQLAAMTQECDSR